MGGFGAWLRGDFTQAVACRSCYAAVPVNDGRQMPAEDFQLQMVTLSLGDDLALVECHGFPEVSSVGESAGRAAVGLRVKVTALLEDAAAAPTASLHRRLPGKDARVAQIGLTLVPARRRADWRQPVELRFDYITWTEAEDLHLAFVPVLGVQVIAAKADQIAGRVEAHVRLVLVDRVKRVTLSRLAISQMVCSLRIDELNVTANLKTPREQEEAKGAEKKVKSVLKEVGTKLTRQNTGPAFELESTVLQLREAFDSRQPTGVLLVGPPGVGKTAAVRELARNYGKAVWSTSGALLIAGQSGFGQWQERCRDLCREAAQAQVILHLGNLLELMEVGQHSANAQSIASFLRPWIARGELLAIAECTPQQLALIERRDPHIAGGFHAGAGVGTHTAFDAGDSGTSLSASGAQGQRPFAVCGGAGLAAPVASALRHVFGEPGAADSISHDAGRRATRGAKDSAERRAGDSGVYA